MSYTYQQLSPADLPTMKKLLKVFGESFGEIETYQSKIPSDEYLKSLLSKNTFIALAAINGNSNGNEVVGGLAAYVLDKFEQERKEIYIYDLAVMEEHRRKGIATTLINTLRRIAKAKGAYVIYVQADKVDAGAIKLYESLGTKEDVFHFDIPPLP